MSGFAVVTGGSSGIGLEIVRSLAADGLQVLTCGSREKPPSALDALSAAARSVAMSSDDVGGLERVRSHLRDARRSGRGVDEAEHDGPGPLGEPRRLVAERQRLHVEAKLGVRLHPPRAGRRLVVGHK